MAFPDIQSIIVKTPNDLVSAFNRFLNSISAFVNAINAKPQIDTIMLSNVQLYEGQNTVPHTLGVPATNFTVWSPQGLGWIYEYQPSNSTTLFLYATQNITVSLEVY